MKINKVCKIDVISSTALSVKRVLIWREVDKLLSKAGDIDQKILITNNLKRHGKATFYYNTRNEEYLTFRVQEGQEFLIK